MEPSSGILCHEIDDRIHPPGAVFESIRQQNPQLHYIFSGEVIIKAGNYSWVQQAGEICRLPPDRAATFECTRHGSTHHGFCTAIGTFHSEHLARYAQPPPAVTITPRIRTMLDLAKTLHGETSTPTRRLYNHTIEMIFTDFFYAAGFIEKKEKLIPDAIEKTIRFMKTHLSEHLDLRQIAQAGGVSHTQLSRLFKTYLDTTPSRYLWHLRAEHAAEQLIHTKLTVSEVAFQCGFSSQEHFSRFFHSHYQMPPGRYRTVFSQT